MKQNGVGYNGEYLSTLSEKDFIKEVKHHFDGPDAERQMKELYKLIKAKYAPEKVQSTVKGSADIQEKGHDKQEG